MDEGEVSQARCVFRGIEYILRVRNTDNHLEVEVEDVLTTDQWRGEFDDQFIEDLTHKTGNFKQFSIFCNMLHFALTQSSETVTLDLLTYSDLELLRHRKAGGTVHHSPTAKSSPLTSKRYLILVYSVAFDRIHYPLPLAYVGKLDPIYLRKVIKGLRDELAAVKSVPHKENRMSASREAEIRCLREELHRVNAEKQQAETTLQRLQDVALHSGNESHHLRILKKSVQTLEAEVQKERNRNQRLSIKRREESRLLMEQLAEARAAERNLHLKVKSLASELAIYKRGRVTPTGPIGRSRSSSAGRGAAHRSGEFCIRRDRSTSRERSGLGSGLGRARQSRSPSRERARLGSGVGRARQSRSPSRERTGLRSGVGRARQSRSPSRERTGVGRTRKSRSPSRERIGPASGVGRTRQARSTSREGRTRQPRSTSRDRSRLSSAEGRCRKHRSSPSPVAILPPRFDPTAYIRDKARKQRAIDARKNLRTLGSPLRRQRGSSSVESLRSPRSYQTSGDEMDFVDLLRNSIERQQLTLGRQPFAPSAWNTRNTGMKERSPSPKRLSSTPNYDQKIQKENRFDPASDLSDIDARLQALQDYMRNLDTRT